MTADTQPAGSADRWTTVLDEALARGHSTAPRRYLDSTSPVAFEELLVPFVEAARTELRREADAACEIFSVAAQTTLERSLLLTLSRLSFVTFASEFSLRQSLSGRFPWTIESNSSHAYQNFLADMFRGGLLEVLREYSALGRLLASWASGWAQSHALLAHRLQRDWPAIRQEFDLAETECSIEDIAPYRSDPHDGGRAVSIVTFPGGRALVYKPRALSMEEGFDKVLRWANANGFSRPYRRVALLPRDGYGWMAAVSASPCTSASEVDAFYERAGGLLCLLSLLQATDIHYENLIACGDQPIVVDLETLVHPRLPRDASTDLGAGAEGDEQYDDFTRALLDSGFLPSARGLDFSALGATGTIGTPFRVARCEAVNSDAMVVTYETYQAPRRQNVPTLAGRQEIAAVHTRAIVAGFGEMLLLTIRNRTSFIGVLGGFAGRPGRLVARSTNAYGLLLHASMQPEFLRDGATRGLLLEDLCGSALERGMRPGWPILGMELQALERLDIPFLVSVCDEPGICWGAPLKQVLARIESMAESDVEAYVHRLKRMFVRLADGSRDLRR